MEEFPPKKLTGQDVLKRKGRLKHQPPLYKYKNRELLLYVCDHPAILLPAGSRIIGCNRFGFTIADC